MTQNNLSKINLLSAEVCVDLHDVCLETNRLVNAMGTLGDYKNASQFANNSVKWIYFQGPVSI